MSEPAFTVILNGEGEIFNLASNVVKLAASVRQRLVGIPPFAPSKDAAKSEIWFMGYAAEVINKQQSISSLLVCAIGDLEALVNEIPPEEKNIEKSYGPGIATSGIVGFRRRG